MGKYSHKFVFATPRFQLEAVNGNQSYLACPKPSREFRILRHPMDTEGSSNRYTLVVVMAKIFDHCKSPGADKSVCHGSLLLILVKTQTSPLIYGPLDYVLNGPHKSCLHSGRALVQPWVHDMIENGKHRSAYKGQYPYSFLTKHLLCVSRQTPHLNTKAQTTHQKGGHNGRHAGKLSTPLAPRKWQLTRTPHSKGGIA